jgi:CRISPR/Cas system CMR subunit Cmr6 (Cas7 group RAMP superfamily)
MEQNVSPEFVEQVRFVVDEVLSEELSKKIQEYVNLAVVEFVRKNELKAKELSLIERILRVEEELKALREIEQTRYETLYKEMNTRFEALQKEMNVRFEALERRFNFLQWFMGLGFSFLAFLITLLSFLNR